MMTIYSGLFYANSLARGDLAVREGRFHAGKYIETLPVWLAYVRKHYLRARLVLFVDEASPVPVMPMLERCLREPWIEEREGQQMEWHDADGSGNPPWVHVKVLTKHCAPYLATTTNFRPMQRNLVEAMSDAYTNVEDMLWIDNDAFVNTDVTPLLHDIDFAAASLEPHQMTAASVFTYISAKRLHAYDRFCSLPTHLTNMVANGPTETRMHSLQEGGLYKLFCFGRTKELGPFMDLAHLNNYPHFVAFLKENPLDLDEYRELLSSLETLVEEATTDGRLDGVDMTFHDMWYSTKAARQGEVPS